ncbi:G-patch domain [Sesbania bispinosa]|nr:G-patch domain [Sesbania bispinosa]
MGSLNANAGIWREAELESWNEEAGVGQVVFRDDGSSMKLGAEGMVLSEYAETSDLESDSSLEQSDSSDYEEEEEEESQGLGFLESTNLQKGIQTETAIFAKWENHTRGVASKMMANMGYREGMGLGVTGQGMLDPIPVKVLPPKQSLDHALESHKGEEITEKQGKKRSRGASNEGSMKKQQSKSSGEGKRVDRRALIAYEDEVKDLKMRVEKLEQMVNANRKEKAVYDAAMRKLIQTRKALADAEAVHASASNAVVSKEKEKRWLKF